MQAQVVPKTQQSIGRGRKKFAPRRQARTRETWHANIIAVAL